MTTNHLPLPSLNKSFSRLEQDYWKNLSNMQNFFLHALLYGKAVLCVSLVVFSLYEILAVSHHWAITLLFCVLLGISISLTGFNVMHDASHNTLFKSKTLNTIVSIFLDHLHGAFFANWRVKHVHKHHINPNVAGEDDDIDTGNLIRMHPNDKWEPKHQYQHIYANVLYCLLYIVWVGFADFNKYFRKRIQKTKLSFTVLEHVSFFSSKIVYFYLYVYLPLQVFTWWQWLIGYAIFSCTVGFLLSNVFQLAHVNEKCAFETMDTKVGMKEHQARTTANFATSNVLCNFFLGGLNHQVEHHLFPAVSHVHYPRMREGVKKVLTEHGIPYHSFPTVSEAMRSHIRYLKKMGQQPQQVSS
jgi:linoleoyl-CoA desaturase